MHWSGSSCERPVLRSIRLGIPYTLIVRRERGSRRVGSVIHGSVSQIHSLLFRTCPSSSLPFLAATIATGHLPVSIFQRAWSSLFCKKAAFAPCERKVFYLTYVLSTAPHLRAKLACKCMIYMDHQQRGCFLPREEVYFLCHHVHRALRPLFLHQYVQGPL